MNNNIKIVDWHGNELYSGDYDSPEVDQVLQANRCDQCDDGSMIAVDGREINCSCCGGTRYSTDFEIEWQNENDKRNVYEYVNY